MNKLKKILRNEWPSRSLEENMKNIFRIFPKENFLFFPCYINPISSMLKAGEPITFLKAFQCNFIEIDGFRLPFGA